LNSNICFSDGAYLKAITLPFKGSITAIPTRPNTFIHVLHKSIEETEESKDEGEEGAAESGGTIIVLFELNEAEGKQLVHKVLEVPQPLKPKKGLLVKVSPDGQYAAIGRLKKKLFLISTELFHMQLKHEGETDSLYRLKMVA